MTELTDLGSAAEGGTSLLIAFGFLLVFITPQWALLFWVARSPHRLQAASRSHSLRLLSATSWIAAVAVGAIGSLWVNDALIGRERVELYHFVEMGALVQPFLLGFAVLFVASRRKAADGPPAPPTAARRRPSPRAISIVLIAWVAAAGVLVALALGPLSGRPEQEHAWRALALALAVIATQIVLLARAIRKTRRTG